MSGAQLIAELENLRGKSGVLLLKRIDTAKTLLSDRDWLAGEPWRGDESKARDTIEEGYFGDLCGTLTLGQLLLLREEYPDDAAWKDAKYNLMVLWAKHEEAHPEPTQQRIVMRVKKADLEKEVELRKTVEFQRNQALKVQAALETDCEQLRVIVANLKEENAQLNGRIMELEKLLDRRFAIA